MTYRPPGIFFRGDLFKEPPAPLDTPEQIQAAVDRKMEDIRNRWEMMIVEPHTVHAIKAEVEEIINWVNELLPPQKFLVQIDSELKGDGMHFKVWVDLAVECEICEGSGQRQVSETDWDGDVHLGTYTTSIKCYRCLGEGKVRA